MTLWRVPVTFVSVFTGRGRTIRAAACSIGLLLALATSAAAQSELWTVAYAPFGTNPSEVSLRVHNIQTGELMALLPVPRDACIGRGVMSHDRRWFFVPTNTGLARIDVLARRVVQIVPLADSCGFSPILSSWHIAGVSPSGRFWHLFKYPDLITIDSVTGQRSSRELPSFHSMTFNPDGNSRYELTRVGFEDRWVVQRWPDGSAETPIWSREFSSRVSALAATTDALYLAMTVTPDLVRIVKLDPATGTEAARVEKTIVNVGGLPGALAVYRNRVFLAVSFPTGVDLPGIRQTLASFDAVTLMPESTIVLNEPYTYGPFVVDDSLATGYVFRTYCYRFNHPCYDSLLTLDPDTLSLSPVIDFHSSTGIGGLGEVRPPSPVQLAGSATGNEITVTWQVDPGDASVSSFDIWGAVRGRLLQRLATADASTRSWTQRNVPRGSYSVGVAARNHNGASDVRQVDVGVDELAIPDAPIELTAATTADVAELRWRPPASGPVPSSYVVEALTAGGSSFVPVTGVRETHLFSPVPPGTWQVRVRGVTSGGLSAPSAAVTLTSAVCDSPPGAPRSLAARSTGHLVTLQWQPPAEGPPRDYELEVQSGFVTFRGPGLPGSRAAFEVAVPSGTYAVRVRARNACGESTPSNEVVVFVP